jgi:tetratricopeptide (TPR) repeat protein
MRQTLHRAVLAAALGAGMAGRVSAQDDDQHHHMSGMPTLAEGSTPLYRDLGNLHRKVSTRSAQAQQYFDQGLRLTYAFNHDEAIGSYTEGTRADSTCAMCWWGIAYAMGPNINAPMDTAVYRPAYAAIQRAVALRVGATPVERDLIDAMAKRYGPEPVANRAPLDSAYAHALAPLAKKYPNDPDVQTLYAESLMDLSPWNYWTDRGTRARPDTKVMVAALEKTIAKYPNHPGACHLYIHAVEASTTPERALPCANRLAELMPGAGHLVHMPSHIYMRTGQYDLAVEHNHHAVAEDETFIQDRRPTGFYQYSYYPHNYHMLWAGLIQLGRGTEAIAASRKIVSVIPIKVVKTVPPLEYFFPTPYWSLVRFGKYDEMLAEPAPARELKYTTGMWHYARGIAAAATDKTDLAKAEQDSVAAIIAATPKEAPAGINSQKQLLTLAQGHLTGRIALAKGDTAAAVQAFQAAIAVEDSLLYDEPPPWYHPIRQELAAVYLAQNKAPEAARLYREDLDQFKNNGWSLYGLAQALERQGKSAEAAKYKAQYEKMWGKADVKPLAERS